jgi:hypothetical protein
VRGDLVEGYRAKELHNDGIDRSPLAHIRCGLCLQLLFSVPVFLLPKDKNIISVKCVEVLMVNPLVLRTGGIDAPVYFSYKTIDIKQSGADSNSSALDISDKFMYKHVVLFRADT